VATDPHFRLHSHWDRHYIHTQNYFQHFGAFFEASFEDFLKLFFIFPMCYQVQELLCLIKLNAMLLKYLFKICSLLVTIIFLYDYTMDHPAVIPCNILHQFEQCLESPKVKLMKKTASTMYLSCMPHHLLHTRNRNGSTHEAARRTI